MAQRSGTWFPALLALTGAAILLVSCGKSEQQESTSMATPAMTPVERGKYLTTVLGCHDCHTPGYFYGAADMNRALSGSELGWQGPWGIAFPRNLTPDMETGIGTWTEQDIVRAIRTGYRPDGTQLTPPMPWPDFASLTDQDAQAVAAYLKSIPAIRHQNLPHVPPGQPYKGSVIVFPPPSNWDVPPPPKK
jgi:mono/diheme cytochrome c family protein